VRTVLWPWLAWFTLGLFAVLLFTDPVGAADQDSYGYPIADGVAATVIGTPRELKYPLPATIPAQIRTLQIFPEHEIPDVFWYARGLKFGFIPHKGEKRPLIFIIAGTGASYRAEKVVSMAKAFYSAGFHVLTLSSPTQLNFLLNASTTHLPGFPQDDAEDLYRAMEMAYAQVRDQIEVSSFYLTGYSLGAFDAAFVAQLDEQRKVFQFAKVLMINPPVDLYHSVDILDHMLVDNIPGGVEGTGAFLNRVIERLSAIYTKDDALSFNDDFLYNVYEELRAEAQRTGEPLSDERKGAAALIGISFRISSASIVFGADVINKSGYIVSPSVTLGKYTALDQYGRASHRVSFVEYVHDMLLPVIGPEYPGKSAEQVIALASLHSIENYLRSAEQIGVVTNADEVILAPGELEYLKQLFGSRIRVYPRGGHCGNMDYRENVEFMLDFFGKKEVAQR